MRVDLTNFLFRSPRVNVKTIYNNLTASDTTVTLTTVTNSLQTYLCITIKYYVAMCVTHSITYTLFLQRRHGLGLFGLQVRETSHNTTRTYYAKRLLSRYTENKTIFIVLTKTIAIQCYKPAVLQFTGVFYYHHHTHKRYLYK